MRISRRIPAWRTAAILFLFLGITPFGVAAQQKQIPADAASDPILRALRA